MDIVVVFAIIVGPILAIQVQKLIERVTQRKNAKEAIFKVLMSTRGIPLSPEHVRALNMIDIEFYGNNKKNKKVIAAWRLYLDVLANSPQDFEAPDYKTKLDAWTNKSIRKGVADLFLGLKSIPIHVVKTPPIKKKENKQEKPPTKELR